MVIILTWVRKRTFETTPYRVTPLKELSRGVTMAEVTMTL